jgi:hypothetical protein
MRVESNIMVIPCQKLCLKSILSHISVLFLVVYFFREKLSPEEKSGSSRKLLITFGSSVSAKLPPLFLLFSSKLYLVIGKKVKCVFWTNRFTWVLAYVCSISKNMYLKLNFSHNKTLLELEGTRNKTFLFTIVNNNFLFTIVENMTFLFTVD